MSTQDENTPDISTPDVKILDMKTLDEQHERIMASIQKTRESTQKIRADTQKIIEQTRAKEDKIDILLRLLLDRYDDLRLNIDALLSTIHTKPTKKQRDLLVSRHTYIKDGIVMVPTIVGGTASNPQMEWKPRD